MTTFEKHYIGKGTQVENLDIIKITMGSGSGSVGRAVASDTRDQRSAKYYIEPKIKKKEARIG